MIENVLSPRILLISQWPNVKNGEYELIEKIKQTEYQIAVVDYLGYDVTTGDCINTSELHHRYDFAISFHYDTPKFLNLPTYLWVANPIEFMHLRHDYRAVLLPQLRAYDGYLFNSSDTLKMHICNLLGEEWSDSGLEMFPACARSAMISPKLATANIDFFQKLFYCGVNWERASDQFGRAQGLLSLLQEQKVIDFYGPNNLDGKSTWSDFTSYKGEIPFDGISMGSVMRRYAAVLAISSPAHIKSHTSSSRVFEGIAAGVPVISDENPHVYKLFGDMVYYFRGNDEEQKVESILFALKEITENPNEAFSRVIRAQELISQRYCFDVCFEKTLETIKKRSNSVSRSSYSSGRPSLDVFLFYHDQDIACMDDCIGESNVPYILEAAFKINGLYGAEVRINCTAIDDCFTLQELPKGVTWNILSPESLSNRTWNKLRLGEKVAALSSKSSADYVIFLTQFDFPHYDSFIKAFEWFSMHCLNNQPSVHIGGFYASELKQTVQQLTAGILRCNTSVGLYRWTKNSIDEHQFGTFFFNRSALTLLNYARISMFDVLLPISIIIDAIAHDINIYRSRHILTRVQIGSFQRHYKAYQRVAQYGFWSQHYNLVTNYTHELNALYDIHHESVTAINIVDIISGKFSLPIDPDVEKFIKRFGKYLRSIKKRINKLKYLLI